MNAFGRFSKAFLLFVEQARRGLTTSAGNTPDNFIGETANLLGNSKVFELTEPVKKLLLLTDPPKSSISQRLPFGSIFLDVAFSHVELESLGMESEYAETFGILVSEQDFIVEEQTGTMTKIGDAGKILRVIVCSKTLNGDTLYDTLNIPKEDFGLKDNVEFKMNPNTPKKFKDFITKFVLNSLNFVNDPEIEWVDIPVNKARNNIRAKKGKFPVPARRKIKLTGKIKRYTSSLGDFKGSRYSHRFWVRGHFRTLRAERYGNNRGKRIWLPPHCRGEGVLVEKNYSLKG